MSREKLLRKAEEQNTNMKEIEEYLHEQLLRGENYINVMGERLAYSDASDLYIEIRQ